MPIRKIFAGNHIIRGGAIFCLAGLMYLFAQDNQLSYLSQKLMLQDNLHQRITEALNKLLDDIRFVVNVNVEIEFAPVEETRTVYEQPQQRSAPVKTPQKAQTTPTQPGTDTRQKAAPVPQKTEPAPVSQDEFSLPLPGFETPPARVTRQPSIVAQPEPEAQLAAEGTEVIEAEIVQESAQVAPQAGAPEMIQRSIQKSTIPVPVVKRQEITIILEDGVSPEMMENVRQVVYVAANYDRIRGDVVTIQTASFKKRKEQTAAEAVILKNIADKIESLEQRQRQEEHQTKINEQKQIERRAVIRDSLRIAELRKQIEDLKQASLSQQISDEQRRFNETQASAHETELNNLRAQLRDSNRRLQELEMGILDTPPPTPRAFMDFWIWIIIGAVIVGLFLALILALTLRRPKPDRAELEWGYGSRIPMGARPPAPAPAPVAAPVVPPVTPPPPAPTLITPENQMRPEVPPAPTPVTPSPAPAINYEEQKEEMKGMRQSIISMSVGQPDAATRILKDWLSQSPVKTDSEEGGL